MTALVVSLNMTFPDSSLEKVGAVFGTMQPGNVTLLSEHANPRAGMLLETVHYISVFLLVEDTSTPTTTSGGNTGASVSSISGLRLIVALNSSAIQSGLAIDITVLENNTLSSFNNVSASKNWPLNNLGVGSCGPVNFPMGFAVYQGHFSSNNISSACALWIYQPGPHGCPMILSSVSEYDFATMSDSASVVGSCDLNPYFTLPMRGGVAIDGNWVGGDSSGNDAVKIGFAPGVYTVAAGDEWGALVLECFIVR
jgi:hypothetical protein